MQEKQGFLTVSQVAEKTGISRQYLYSEMNKKGGRFESYIVKLNGKKYLKESVLQEVFHVGGEDQQKKAEQTAEEDTKKPKEEQPGTESEDPTQLLIAELRATISRQDRQIADQRQQIDRLYTLLDQEQRLNGGRLAMKDPEDGSAVEQAQPKKKGLLSWFRRHD